MWWEGEIRASLSRFFFLMRSHTQRDKLCDQMFDTVHGRSEHVLYPDVVDQSGSLARTALSKSQESDLILLQINTNFMSFADYEDGDMDKLHPLWFLNSLFFRRHGETWEHQNYYPKLLPSQLTRSNLSDTLWIKVQQR